MRLKSLLFPVFFGPLLFVTLIDTFFPPQLLHAEEVKTITVGVQNFANYLPFSSYKSGNYEGFNRELLDLFAKSRSYKFVYKAYPLKRLYLVFLEGRVDLKYPDNPYWWANRKKGAGVVYSLPVVEYIDGVMVRPENSGRGIGHLKKLGVVAGFSPIAYFNLIKEGKVSVVEIFNYGKLLNAALFNKIDGAYSNIIVSSYQLRHTLRKPGALVFAPELPHTRSQRHLSSIKYPKIIKEFNAFIEREDERVKALKKKYGVEKFP